jgi:hypothetical protein
VGVMGVKVGHSRSCTTGGDAVSVTGRAVSGTFTIQDSRIRTDGNFCSDVGKVRGRLKRSGHFALNHLMSPRAEIVMLSELEGRGHPHRPR